MARVKADAGGWIRYELTPDRIATNRLAGAIEGFVHDCRLFARLAREARLEGLPQALNLTWDEFCSQRLNQSSEVVEAIIAGIEVIGDEVPVPAELAERVGRHALLRRGTNQHTKGCDNVTSSFKRGNEREYILARLDRDQHHQLAADVRARRISAHAAAKQLGWRKTPTPLDQLRHWWRKASATERAAFLKETS